MLLRAQAQTFGTGRGGGRSVPLEVIILGFCPELPITNTLPHRNSLQWSMVWLDCNFIRPDAI